MNIPENILNTLTEEQMKKVEAAQSPEELLALAKEAGYELSTDELEAVSDGWFDLDDAEGFSMPQHLHILKSFERIGQDISLCFLICIAAFRKNAVCFFNCKP